MRYLFSWITAGIVVFISGFSPASSTVIETLSFKELATESTIIVEATVIADSKRTEIRRGIPWTCLTLKIQQILKGSVGPQKEICFYGGVYGGYIFQASGMTLPKEGRQGFFFIDDTRRDITNPIIGWDQGAFYIESSSRGDRVTTFRGDPIASIEIGELEKQVTVSGAPHGVIVSQSAEFSREQFVEITLRALSGGRQ